MSRRADYWGLARAGGGECDGGGLADGISEQTFYRWKAKYGGMQASDRAEAQGAEGRAALAASNRLSGDVGSSIRNLNLATVYGRLRLPMLSAGHLVQNSRLMHHTTDRYCAVAARRFCEDADMETLDYASRSHQKRRLLVLAGCRSLRASPSALSSSPDRRSMRGWTVGA